MKVLSLLLISSCFPASLPFAAPFIHHLVGRQQAVTLTLVAAVFKLGLVVVLVGDHDGDLADPDERLVRLIRGRDRQREFPLPLSVEAYRRGDVTWRDHITMATVTNGESVRRWCVWLVTSVRVDVEARRDAVSVHDAVLDLPVHARVRVLGLDAQDGRPRRLVFQNHGVLTVVVTLREQTQVRQQRDILPRLLPDAPSPPGRQACCC